MKLPLAIITLATALTGYGATEENTEFFDHKPYHPETQSIPNAADG